MCAEELEEDGVAAPKQIGFAGGSGGGRPESQLVNAVSDHMLEVCDD
jgi:prolyl oligopeptidase PreP (S9A serine peptidase family)